MKPFTILLLFFIPSTIVYSCFATPERPKAAQALENYRAGVSILFDKVDSLAKIAEESVDIDGLKRKFKEARLAWKGVEWLAEYYQPHTSKFINGPAIPEVEADNKSIVIEPEGFQVVEELLFDDDVPKEELLHNLKLLKTNVGRLKVVSANLETTDSHIFDAWRLELFRVITLGISGFDSPVAQHSVPEAAEVLRNFQTYLSVYKSGSNAIGDLESKLKKALIFLEKNNDFNSFDRMAFIRGHMNPIGLSFGKFQKELNIPFFTEPRPLRATALTLFDTLAFNPNFYAPGSQAYSSSAKIALGKRLFYDKILSKGGQRSCGSCHNPEKAFADGLKLATSIGGQKSLSRNTPTLLNAGLQPSLFYDLRVDFLEDQAKTVITNVDEMHGNFEDAILRLKEDKSYQVLFQNAYENQTITEWQIRNSLASYIRSLTFLNSYFDEYMRGHENALTSEQLKGFNLFMGKAKCGTCHFAPVFNGVNPPNFTKVDAEVIGVPATVDTLKPRLDKDGGKYVLYSIDLHRNAFKTPGLRNIALTAPYMHNGVYESLEEVIEFYNRGGGRGMGIEISNQTLPEDKLLLTEEEKKSLVAFLKSLNDRVID